MPANGRWDLIRRLKVNPRPRNRTKFLLWKREAVLVYSATPIEIITPAN